MQWVLDNWLLILLVVGMIVMHFGHGMHGGKGGHGAGNSKGHGEAKEAESELEAEPAPPLATATGNSKIPKISSIGEKVKNPDVL